MRAKDLGLIEPALSGAVSIQEKHPDAVFTSGRRSRESQAHAMAANVSIARDWIRETYRDTAETRACQAWVDDHPKAATVPDLYAGLLSVLEGFSDDELAEWNHHLAGLAFDLQPIEDEEKAEAIKADVRALPGLDLFLEREGGLVRWHAQFRPAA